MKLRERDEAASSRRTAVETGKRRVRSGSRPVLLTAFYDDPHATRRDEFLDCLRRNVTNSPLAEVHLFLEDDARPEIDHTKLRIVELGRRATYRDLFDYANAELAGRRAIIANADIYFARDVARLGSYDLTGTLLCLSRWDVRRDGTAQLFEHGESQDAWIFASPIPRFRASSTSASRDATTGSPGRRRTRVSSSRIPPARCVRTTCI